MVSKNKFFLIGLFGLLFSICFSACFSGDPRVNKRVVVKVNDRTLTAGEFAQSLAERLKDFDALSVQDRNIILRNKNDVVSEFVIASLTRDWARKNNIFVRADDLDQRIYSIRKTYPDDLSFRRAMANESVSFQQWKARLEYSLLQELVLKKIVETLPQIKEEELKSYYDKHREEFETQEKIKVRQIVLEKESDARRIEKELRKGKSLKELAENFSVTPEGRSGGDVGWIQRGTLDVFDKVFNFTNGQRSSVMESSFGFHIIEVVDRRRPKLLPLNEVKDKIRQTLREDREQAAYTAWLDKEIRAARVFKDEALIEEIGVQTRNETD